MSAITGMAWCSNLHNWNWLKVWWSLFGLWRSKRHKEAKIRTCLMPLTLKVRLLGLWFLYRASVSVPHVCTTSCETNARLYDQLNLLSPFRSITNGSPESSSELTFMVLFLASSFLVTSAMPLVSSCCYSTQTSCCWQEWLPGIHILKASFADLNLCNDSAVSQLSLSTSNMVFRASLKALTPSASSRPIASPLL